MMRALPAVVDSLEKIPTALRDAYDRDDDGRWRLQVEPVDGIELGDVAGTKAEVDRLWSALSGQVRNAAVDKAVIDAGGDPLLLRPHVEKHLIVDRKTLALKVVGSDGKRLFKSDKTLKTVADIVADLKAREDFAPAFASRADNRQANDTPIKSDVPVNLTEKMRAMRAQPAPEAPRPVTLSPSDPRFNFSAAMAWARGKPQRIAELKAHLAIPASV